MAAIDPPPPATQTPPSTPPPAARVHPLEEEFELLPEGPPPGLIRRFLTTQRHFLGLLGGAVVDWVRLRKLTGRRGLTFWLARVLAVLVRPFLARSIRSKPFPVQLRRRLETLGPTYIKLGQVLSLRQDLLPPALTDELANLLDRLPVMPFSRFLEKVATELPRPVDDVYEWIDPRPLGSASIAQVHRARLATGEDVILKMVKPGIREILELDARLLWLLGWSLQILFPRFQPKRILDEFVEYTLREVDLRLEADNAETFAANFREMPDVVFPRIYRSASTRNLLTMQYLEGVKPTSTVARDLSDEERQRLVDIGGAAIIKMIYQDGFFHADLHPGNLLILPGARIGFIDLGMVGRFGDELRRTLLYYYFALISGDPDSAARYLTLVARPGVGADPEGFRREVADVCRRWQRAAGFREFNLGQLILRSVERGVAYRMYFPVEMVLMVKAIVTYEGVGQIMMPGFDVKEISLHHARWIFLRQFSPLHLARETMKSAPEMMEALFRSPMLISEGMRLLERQSRRPPEGPLSGLRGTLLGGFSLLASGIFYLQGSYVVAASLVLVGLILVLRRG